MNFIECTLLMPENNKERFELLDLIFRLETRSLIRRQIQTRKSVQEGKSDRISDLLEEAADTLRKFL